MKIKYLCALLLAALTYSCDDTTPGIGDTTIPDGDHIQAGGKIYDVTTRSILADSVYARTSTAYLGPIYEIFRRFPKLHAHEN